VASAMASELWPIFAGILLGIVHVSVDSFSFKAQEGNAYTVGARDEARERKGVAGRLHRAARNYTENFVLFVATLLLLLHSDALSSWGLVAAWVWVGARCAYLLAYASGIPWTRTICWQIAMIGLVVMLVDAFV
jgi:uncharacterized MAPEG superfamily protein